MRLHTHDVATSVQQRAARESAYAVRHRAAKSRRVHDEEGGSFRQKVTWNRRAG